MISHEELKRHLSYDPCWHKNLCKWTVSFKKNKKQVHVGCFDDLDEAISASMMARAENFGEFARQRIE